MSCNSYKKNGEEMNITHKILQVQKPCDLRIVENAAIATTYFCVGIVLSILNTPLSVYLVEELGVEPAQSLSCRGHSNYFTDFCRIRFQYLATIGNRTY